MSCTVIAVSDANVDLSGTSKATKLCLDANYSICSIFELSQTLASFHAMASGRIKKRLSNDSRFWKVAMTGLEPMTRGL